MGSSSNESNSLIVIMKYLAILAIALFAVVAAEPEAEADAEAAAAYYGGYYGHPYRYGYGLGGYYGGYYGHRFGYGYGLGYRHFGKREAEADPALVYAHAYAPYAAYPYRAPASSSFQHVSTPAATYGLSQLHKRSADAEPEADADAAAAYYGGYYGHPGYYGYGYGYGLGYRGYY